VTERVEDNTGRKVRGSGVGSVVTRAGVPGRDAAGRGDDVAVGVGDPFGCPVVPEVKMTTACSSLPGSVRGLSSQLSISSFVTRDPAAPIDADDGVIGFGLGGRRRRRPSTSATSKSAAASGPGTRVPTAPTVAQFNQTASEATTQLGELDR